MLPVDQPRARTGESQSVAILIENLLKQYVAPDGTVVRVIDVPHFELADGEQVALIGTSGSGKTTLLHLIAGILTPDSGKIVFDDSSALRGSGGVNIGSLPEARRDV